MSVRSVLKVFPILLLSFGPVVGMYGVSRSEVMVEASVDQSQVINQLIQQLKTEDLEIRSNAAKSLGRMGESAIPALIPLLDNQDMWVRSSAADALGEMGESAKAISVLMPLRKDQDSLVRSRATKALKKLGYKP